MKERVEPSRFSEQDLSRQIEKMLSLMYRSFEQALKERVAPIEQSYPYKLLKQLRKENNLEFADHVWFDYAHPWKPGPALLCITIFHSQLIIPRQNPLIRKFPFYDFNKRIKGSIDYYPEVDFFKFGAGVENLTEVVFGSQLGRPIPDGQPGDESWQYYASAQEKVKMFHFLQGRDFGKLQLRGGLEGLELTWTLPETRSKETLQAFSPYDYDLIPIPLAELLQNWSKSRKNDNQWHVEIMTSFQRKHISGR